MSQTSHNLNVIKSVFKRGSKTYYYSSMFFPKKVRRDVSILYSFVRKADDYVDTIPQEKEEFYRFKNDYLKALDGEKSNRAVIDSFVELLNRMDFDPSWIEAFLNSMEMDMEKSSYEDIDELKDYLFGSSEVIGLMMAKIMGLPEESYRPAKYLGRAMQYINFIRDIEEDIGLGRHYFPKEDMERFGLDSLKREKTKRKKEAFKAFIDEQVDRFYRWQEIAEEGFRYIPKRYLIPIKTASDMYKWTARSIDLNPFLVYDLKLKPSKLRIVGNGLMNIFYPKERYENPTV